MKKIFIAFAIEDKFARDNIKYQSERQINAPFEFVDMSVQEPWSSSWKTNCRERIKQCDGVVAFLSRNTPNADGARWEIKCALEERIPLRAFWVHADDKCCRPTELQNASVYEWTWDNVRNFINAL